MNPSNLSSKLLMKSIHHCIGYIQCSGFHQKVGGHLVLIWWFLSPFEKEGITWGGRRSQWCYTESPPCTRSRVGTSPATLLHQPGDCFIILMIIIICCKTLNSLFLNYNIWRRQDLPPAPSDHSKVRAPAQAQVGKPTSVDLLRLAQAPQMSGARPREGSGKPTSWQACSFSEGEHNLQDNDKGEPQPAKRDHCCFLLSFKYRDQLIFLWLGVEGTYWEGS